MFNLHIFVNFLVFLLLINLYFSPVMVGKMLDITSVFLNFLRFLWPNIWSVLENIPCTLENNMYLVALVLEYFVCMLSPPCAVLSRSVVSDSL